MNNPWKRVALLLGAMLVALLIVTLLFVNGILEFGFSAL